VPVPTRNQCAFCPERANLTCEHLWSKWAEKHLIAGSYLHVHREEENDVIKMWQKKKLDHKARVVCGECNNSWMSELESAIQSVTKDMMFNGVQTTLSARDLATIAAFGFMKAVVADHMHSKRPPILTFSERRLFARTLQIPGGVQMWLSSTVFLRGLFKSQYVEIEPPDGRTFYLQAFTYGLGHFVIQVVICRWKKKVLRRHAHPPFLRQAVGWIPMSIPFWPHDGTPVRWPPATHLSDQIIDKFVQRWTRIGAQWW
jgi:Zn ribbon nucleic-acid-binding protein